MDTVNTVSIMHKYACMNLVVFIIVFHKFQMKLQIRSKAYT